MKFIKIFERKDTIGFMCTDTIELTQVVNTELTDEQFEELINYFEEIDEQFVHSPVLIEGIRSVEIDNCDEILENSPLPDGTIILTEKFEEGGTYIVVIGEDKDNAVIGLAI